MRIKSKTTCWTPYPEMSWSAGEIKEVSDEVGEKLLKNNNFVKVSAKPETESEVKKDELRNRKKRGIGRRA